MEKVERGKPHERETQINGRGAFFLGSEREEGQRLHAFVDR